MESRIVAMIRYEAKRRPNVQALVDRAADLTDEEIENADVPLKWYKQGLTELRFYAIRERNSALAQEALESNYETSVNFQMGDICVYAGEDSFEPFDFEIKKGDLVWVADDGVWYDHLFSKNKNIPTTFVKKALKKDYREERQKQLAERHGLDYGTTDDNYTSPDGQRRITSAMFRGSNVPVIRF